MARLARVVVPGHPHHVTQRGNGRARTFFGDDDYALYRDLLAENCRAADVDVWAWCLMPNHVHLILLITVTVHSIDRLAPSPVLCRMARLARVVVPGHPHHVTQRGNGRARTFFGDDDYALYRDLLAEHPAARPMSTSGPGA